MYSGMFPGGCQGLFWEIVGGIHGGKPITNPIVISNETSDELFKVFQK